MKLVDLASSGKDLVFDFSQEVLDSSPALPSNAPEQIFDFSQGVLDGPSTSSSNDQEPTKLDAASALAKRLKLSPEHYAELVESSGIEPWVLEHRRPWTATKVKELLDLGYSKDQAKLVPALVLPLWGIDKNVVGHQIKPVKPRTDLKQKKVKYESPKGSKMRLDVSPAIPEDWVKDVKIPLWITEGLKKVDSALSRSLFCIGLLGVYGWKTRNDDGDSVELEDWDAIALEGRTVYLAFDSDILTKQEVRKALKQLAKMLRHRGAHVLIINLPAGDGEKVGLDNYFVKGGQPQDLIDSATEEIPGEDEPDFPFTDLGNAKHFRHLFGADLRYCPDLERWFSWTGSIWEEDSAGNGNARARAHTFVETLSRSPQESVAKWGATSQSTGRINNLIREAQAFPELMIRAKEFDQDPWLLACTNGVVDLQTGTLLESQEAKGRMLTRACKVPFAPDAKCPTFLKFLSEITLERLDLADCLLRCLGYCLSGSTREQKFFIFYGERGRNGKSTLLELMHALLGEQLCGQVDKKLLSPSQGDATRFSMSNIEGRRLVHASEINVRARLNVEFIKDFVGGNSIRVERKGKEVYEVRNQAKFIYSLNKLPQADFDPSFRSRIVAFPFDQSFYDESDPEYQLGDLPPDKDLPRKLAEELPGILVLLIEACKRWLECGDLGQPKEVRELEHAYAAENDHFQIWFDEHCQLDDQASERVGELFKSYTAFLKGSGMAGFTRLNEFVGRMKRLLGEPGRVGGNGKAFNGVRLTGTSLLD